MQVKKFEAKTIKEAIEMVKVHLGPDAIILSAKDNSKGFGLMGGTSVEVTAAVSETKLRQKKLAEKKLNEQNKIKFTSASARTQKEFINKAFENQATLANYKFEESSGEQAEVKVTRPAVKRPPTSARYIDIDDSENVQKYAAYDNTAHEAVAYDSAPRETASRDSAPRGSAARIASPQISSYNTSTQGQHPQYVQPYHMQNSMQTPASNHSQNIVQSKAQDKINSLQNEINYLKSLLEKFQQVPQNFITLHPGADEGLPFELSFAFKKLQSAGLSQQYIVEILKEANRVLPNEQKKKKAFVDGWVIKYLLDNTHISERPLKSKYHIFVGPTGQGKTSTVVKMACELAMKEKKRIAILSGDHTKIGASEQLKIYAQILNVPFAEINNQQDWQLIQKSLSSFDHVLLDTPGVNLRTEQEAEKLKAILPPSLTGMNVHYVQSVMARDTDAFEVADRFRRFGFSDVIFTRLDEAVQHGLIYNFSKNFAVPIHSFGIGNAIPEDYELATKERVVDLIFNLSNLKKKEV